MLKNDSFIISTEGNPLGRCYRPAYHLNRSVAHSIADWWGGRTILQWLVISEPGHPFLRRALENMVELISLEYRRESVLDYPPDQGPVSAIFCCTGPNVFTASVLEVINELESNVSYRYVGDNWRVYGGWFKADSYKGDNGPRYEHLMNHMGTKFLKSYTN